MYESYVELFLSNEVDMWIFPKAMAYIYRTRAVFKKFIDPELTILSQNRF